MKRSCPFTDADILHPKRSFRTCHTCGDNKRREKQEESEKQESTKVDKAVASAVAFDSFGKNRL